MDKIEDVGEKIVYTKSINKALIEEKEVRGIFPVKVKVQVLFESLEVREVNPQAVLKKAKGPAREKITLVDLLLDLL